MSYDNFAETFSKSRKNHPWPELDIIIEDMKSRGYQSILDIGCGNGRFLEESSKREFFLIEYLGTDNSLGMIREAQKLHPDKSFEVIAMEDLGNNSGNNFSQFDAILILASFHHLKDYETRLKVLSEIRQFLNPNGRVYMTNWNLRDQEKYQKNHRGNGDFDIKIGQYVRYYHSFTLEELSTLYKETKWKVLRHEISPGGRNILSILSL